MARSHGQDRKPPCVPPLLATRAARWPVCDPGSAPQSSADSAPAPVLPGFVCRNSAVGPAHTEPGRAGAGAEPVGLCGALQLHPVSDGRRPVPGWLHAVDDVRRLLPRQLHPPLIMAFSRASLSARRTVCVLHSTLAMPRSVRASWGRCRPRPRWPCAPAGACWPAPAWPAPPSALLRMWSGLRAHSAHGHMAHAQPRGKRRSSTSAMMRLRVSSGMCPTARRQKGAGG
jgi:hypothetical protein